MNSPNVFALPETQGHIIDWFEANGRHLPWRATRDPWAILVSEVMLSQTQVARVVDPWQQFCRRFPTPQQCAAAPRSAVIEAWATLGFNRRAVNLHRAASQIVNQHGGSVPDDLDDLLALPGVGPYIARAVRVFAFELHDAVVDTNVARVFARVGGGGLSRAQAHMMADQSVPSGQAWAWNQAMIELGATVCRARTQDCDRCVVADQCRWQADGHPPPDPARAGFGAPKPQGRFHGSDRQIRGRVVDALRQRPLDQSALVTAIDWNDQLQHLERILDGLKRDGLIVETDTGYALAP